MTLLGGRGDIPDFLQALDVAVCSSNWEGSPLSVMEYMEAELPVVATRVGGIPDMISSWGGGGAGAAGQPRGDRRARSRDLLRNPDEAAEMGRRGQRRRREEFDLDVTARRIGDLYEELYAASGRGA